MKVLGALDSPNGITNHSYNPSLVLNAVFYSSTGRILIWWYPLLRSILEKTLTPDIRSSISSRRGMGKWYLTVILLIVRTIHTHTLCTILLWHQKCGNCTWAQALFDDPLSSNSSTCRYNSACSVGFIL